MLHEDILVDLFTASDTYGAVLMLQQAAEAGAETAAEAAIIFAVRIDVLFGCIWQRLVKPVMSFSCP